MYRCFKMYLLVQIYLLFTYGLLTLLCSTYFVWPLLKEWLYKKTRVSIIHSYIGPF